VASVGQIVEVAPGAVHLPGWLSADQQRDLVVACREWAVAPAGMRATVMPSGGVMSVQTVCLGWHWAPYQYSKTTEDGSSVKPFPGWLGALARRAVIASGVADGEQYQPDTALINFYDAVAKMGLHQDKDERSLAPVVSFSLGDSCRFRFGNTANRGRPWTDLVLDSGDLFVFGGPSRMAYHGVPSIFAGTGPADLGLTAGRLNITVRESGLRAEGAASSGGRRRRDPQST
jgi:DNA oxidative demethylase